MEGGGRIYHTVIIVVQFQQKIIHHFYSSMVQMGNIIIFILNCGSIQDVSMNKKFCKSTSEITSFTNLRNCVITLIRHIVFIYENLLNSSTEMCWCHFDLIRYICKIPKHRDIIAKNSWHQILIRDIFLM